MQLGLTIKTLQKLGMYHGSIVQINSTDAAHPSAAAARVSSLGHAAHAASSQPSACSVDGLDAPNGAQHQTWRHDTAYLSPLLAFNLGFQPQLAPFLQLNAGQHVSGLNQPTSQHDQQLGSSARKPLLSESSDQLHVSDLGSKAMSSARDHEQSAAGPSGNPHQRDGHNHGHRPHPSGSAVQAQQGRLGPQNDAASALQLCDGDQPWWAWVRCNVTVQALQSAGVTADKQPASTVPIPNPGTTT